ncbi:wax ester synthase/diacylglycerol acyltransferase 5-like [Diospyros lotus]|uniref:wax ester synthase/diacylglycerol acyltransferase 5-like n=1 Tax=Diospyros lotus TaxID=55363 RepID=UPI0022515979|nr:wax ester synthase/diacylglycerol acyltransferase 5-like [Diospyros lotus]
MDASLPPNISLRSVKTGREGRGLCCDSLNESGSYRSDHEDGLGEPLSPIAQMFHEPGTDVYILGVVGVKAKIDPDVVKEKLAEVLLKLPRFSSSQVLDPKSGKWNWTPTEVNLDDHIVIPELKLDNMESPDKIVEDYIADLTTTGVPDSRPLWDLHLLNIKTSESEGVMIFRVHHSIGDGVSIMSLMLASSRKISDPQMLPTVPVVKRSSSVKLGLWHQVKLVWNTIIDLILFLATVLFLKDTETPLKAGPNIGYKRRVLVKGYMSLDDVKLVKKAVDATINDIVLGISVAGLSRYLNRRYGNERKSERGPIMEKNHLPKHIRLRTQLWVNIRPVPGIQELMEMVDKCKNPTASTWGNNIGYAVLPLAIQLREDPLDYIRQAKASVDRKKASLEAPCVYFFAKLISKLFGTKVAGLVNFNIFTNCTLWFSNVPGTSDRITYCGYEVSYYAPTCFGQPNGLMINVVSYVDKLIFVISAAEETIPDPHQMWDDIEVSLKLIKDAALASTKTH